jgi:hypothetical protein
MSSEKIDNQVLIGYLESAKLLVQEVGKNIPKGLGTLEFVSRLEQGIIGNIDFTIYDLKEHKKVHE